MAKAWVHGQRPRAATRNSRLRRRESPEAGCEMATRRLAPAFVGEGPCECRWPARDWRFWRRVSRTTGRTFGENRHERSCARAGGETVSVRDDVLAFVAARHPGRRYVRL